MNTMKICSGCQKLLEANAPDGLCPECLLKAGLGTGVDLGPDSQAESGRIPFLAPSVDEVARLFPQVEILGFIGQGGMGAVYKARQKSLDRVVALKILPPGIGKDPPFAERFTREAKALARLNHPGVVTIYEFGQADGLFYFLMEFVDGISLRHLLEVERISAREALAIVPQICDALQYAHDQGIVHRDIKPENILLDRQGRVKVADFGLAKLVGTDAGGSPLTSALSHSMGEGGVSAPVAGTPPSASLTDAGKVMGTPQYMAPEQREHPTEVDHRADIFSLGVVFYQMLTGELPGKPIEAPSHKVQIDVRLDEVVLRALEKEPARRYQQVSQVKTAVETITTSAAPGRSPNQAEVPQPFPKWLLFRIGLPKWPARPAATRGRLGAALMVGVLVWLFVAGTATLITWIRPESWKVVAVISCPLKSQPGSPVGDQFKHTATMIELMRSDVILGRVMDRLQLDERSGKLDERWGKHKVWLKLPKAQAMVLLKRRLDVRSEGATLIQVGVFGKRLEEPEEAMDIANTIAEELRAFRLEQHESPAEMLEMTLRFSPPYILLGLAAGLVLGLLAGGLVLWREFLRQGSQASPVKTAVDTIAKNAPPRFSRTAIVALVLSIGGCLVSLLVGLVLFQSWGWVYGSFYVIETAALVLGIVAWERRTGKAAVILSFGLMLAWIPGVTTHMAQIAPGNLPKKSQLKAATTAYSTGRFSQGNVELVAVSYHPSTNQPWWRPDGSTCSEGPFELRSRTSTTGESMTREFVIRMTGLPADASGPVWKLDRGSWASSMVHVHGQPVPDLQGISATVPKSARTVTIKVGVGMGAWETVANQVPGGSGMTGVSHQGSNWVVSFPKAEGGLGGARILVTHTVKDWETRVLAVDLDGKEHPATGSESSGTDAFTQIIAKFPDLPLERVKEFQFQVRPYQWVEFRDVALEPKLPPAPAPPPPEKASRTFTLSHMLASEMAEHLGQILLGRSGMEARPAPDNMQLTVTAPPDVLNRVSTFVAVTDWPKRIAPGPDHYYPREDVEQAGRSFFYACSIEDIEGVTRMLAPGVLAELKGTNLTAHGVLGEEKDAGLVRQLRGNWEGKEAAVRGVVMTWNRFALRRLQVEPRTSISFGLRYFTSAAFEGAPDSVDLSFIPDRTGGTDGPLMIDTLPPWFTDTRDKPVQQALSVRPLPGSVTEIFGPVVERVISTQDSDDQGLVFFDLETGKSFKPPYPLTFHSNQGPAFVELTPELKEWIKARDVDLLLHLGEKTWDLMTLEMQEDFAGQLNEWETISPEKVIGIFAKKDANHLVRDEVPASSFGHSYPDGFGSFNAFRTRGNTIGVYQFEGVDNSTRHGVGLRYKLVQSPPVGAASPPADTRRYPAMLLVIDGPSVRATTRPLTALKGEVRFMLSNEVAAVHWEFVKTTPTGDMYRFTRKIPADPKYSGYPAHKGEQQTATKEVVYIGRELVIWQDKQQRIALRPGPSNRVSQANAPRISGGEALGQHGFRAKETWKDVGAQSPEAALQTLLWAAREKALARFDDMVFLPRRPDDGWYGSYTNDVPCVVGRVKQCNGVTIKDVKYEGTGVAVIEMAIDGIPTNQVVVSKNIRMIQVGTEWKCDYPHDSLVAFKIRDKYAGEP